jgi:DNA gyrase subunit B
MSIQSSEYSAQSIKVLKGLEAVKKRPGMYIGDTEDGSGLHHMVYEVVDNSIDEALAGYCNRIIVKLLADGSVSVLDNGRGIPTDIHKEEGVSAAELIMTQLHAGGKFDDNSYKVSGGLHGVGVSVVNALSEWLLLTIWRNGQKFTMSFKNGFKEQDIEAEPSNDAKRTGTEVQFFPSSKTFSQVTFDFNILEHRLRELAFLNPEISIELYDCRVDPERAANLHYEGGILNFIKFLDKSKKAIHDTIRITGEQNDIVIDVAFQWNDSYRENTLVFTNNIRQKEGGAHLTGFRSALTRAVNSYIEGSSINKKQRVKLAPEDMREGLTYIVSVRVPDPKFSSQTKDKLISSEVRSVVETIVLEKFSRWLETNPKDSKVIIGRMTESAIAREASRKARDLSRQQNVHSITALPGKLANCQEKDPAKSELFLVEGDSAGGSAKQGRNRKTQAVLPLKGKILNVEKARFDKVLDSQEVGTLITALRLTLNDKEFDLSNLRYHKIIIMTDADVDGMHIQTLILTFFFRYLPEIIKRGFLYIAQPPLYKAKRGQNSTFLKNEEKLQLYLKEIIFNNIKIRANGQDREDCYTRETLANIISFASIIDTQKQHLPEYIVENLFLLGYFSGDSFNEQKLISSFNKQYENERVTWKLSQENSVLIISKSIRSVCHTYKVSQSLISTRANERLEKLSKDLQTFLEGENLYFKDKQIAFQTISQLKCSLFSLARKGLYIQRFKGLGEMNPDQLWETTLDPEHRVLLQVTIEDPSKAESVFSTLMGDVVEPRREFIQSNALKALNIDY